MPRTDEREYAIELPGVPSDLQSRAERDIELLAGCIAAVAKTMGRPFMLNLIRVTDRFQDDVNQVLKRRSGHAGYVATRSNIRAIGKTLWTRSERGDLGFAVVIDANQMGPWGLENPTCLTTILHELSHVLYEVRHIEKLGDEEYCSDTDTAERLLDGWARTLVNEFDVDRLVDCVVPVMATKDDGQPWSLRELDEAQSVDWVDLMLTELEQMPRFIDDVVFRYQIRQIDTDELFARVVPHVRDTLVVLSHTAARYMGAEMWPEIIGRIKKTEGCQRFLKEHLDTILEQLNGPQRPCADRLEVVAEGVQGILGYCGLSFTTVPGGVYVAVEVPSRS